MNKRKAAILILLAAFFAVCFTGCGGESEAAVRPVALVEDEIPEVEEVLPVQLLISCVGDVMAHQSQITAQYDAAADTYDFSNNFIYVKKYIENSDLALCNLETTFGGKPYAGYPMFSAPDELARALRQAGFDVALTANNHLMDRGISGLRRTIEILLQNKLVTVGSRAEADMPRYAIIDIKGVKVGIIAHTYASSSSSGNLLVNGSTVSREAAELIDYFRYSHLDEDLAKIKETADEARRSGADIIIAYYHWGEEYQLRSNEMQRNIAMRTVNDIGADIIFASHPHTIQEISLITNDSTGKQVPVFYSLGNFISNQRVETLTAPNVRYTEIGMIAQVKLEYNTESKEITYLDVAAVPTWVEKYKSGGKDIYAIIPLDDGLAENQTLMASGHLARAQKALEDANGIIGSNQN